MCQVHEACCVQFALAIRRFGCPGEKKPATTRASPLSPLQIILFAKFIHGTALPAIPFTGQNWCHRFPTVWPSASQQQSTPPKGGVPTFNCQTSAGGYLASECRSSSGQGPLPMTVVETPNIFNRCVSLHSNAPNIYIRTDPLSLIVLNGKTPYGQGKAGGRIAPCSAVGTVK